MKEGTMSMSSPPPDLFSCEKCDSTFVTKRSLDFHCKAFHPHKLTAIASKNPTSSIEASGKKEQKESRKVQVKIEVEDEEEKSPPSPASVNEDFFPCRLCNRDFTFEDQLTHHLNTVHSEVSITVAKPVQPPAALLQKSAKPRTSLLKRPLEAGESYGNPSRKKKALPKPEHVAFKHGDFQLNGNFEITEVVRSLLISHMKAESGQETNPLDRPSPSTTSITKVPSQRQSNGRGQEDSDDEDEFEGEGSDGEESHPTLPQVIIGSDDGGFTCQECGALFQSALKLERHMDHHASSANRPYKCSICGDARGFVRKEHLTKHMSSVHSGMKFTCEFCGKDISRRDHLVRHIRTVHRCEIPVGLDFHSNASNFQAPTSVSPTPIKMEIDEISDKAIQSMQPKPKKPYTKCDMCDETFTHLDTLFQHQRDAHGDIRKYDCDVCPKSFKRREHLQKHIVLHTGEKKFSCDHCAKSFPRRDALQDHYRRIHGTSTNSSESEDLPCSLCDKVFLNHSNLIRHRNQVHNITLAVAIANGPLTEADYGDEEEEESGTVLVRKQRRPPLPGLLPIQHFRSTALATNN